MNIHSQIALNFENALYSVGPVNYSKNKYLTGWNKKGRIDLPSESVNKFNKKANSLIDEGFQVGGVWQGCREFFRYPAEPCVKIRIPN